MKTSYLSNRNIELPRCTNVQPGYSRYVDGKSPAVTPGTKAGDAGNRALSEDDSGEMEQVEYSERPFFSYML